jgi:hypothetical protein
MHSLISRGKVHTMKVGSQDASTPLDHGVSEVDDRASRLRPNISPILLQGFEPRRQDLETPKNVK